MSAKRSRGYEQITIIAMPSLVEGGTLILFVCVRFAQTCVQLCAIIGFERVCVCVGGGGGWGGGGKKYVE